MHFLKSFQYKILKYDLVNKFLFQNKDTLPQLKKIILNFNSKKNDLKELASGLLALELISNQKGVKTLTKESRILLKIRKGNPIGCKVILRGNTLYNFLGKIILNIFPRLKNFSEFKLSSQFKKNTFSFRIYEIFSFYELENHYYFFSHLDKLDITIVSTAKNKKELIFLLTSYQFPLNVTNHKIRTLS